MTRSLFIALVAGGALLPSQSALAYETAAHARFSLEAARESSLDARLPDVGANMKLFNAASLLPDGGLYLFGFTLFQAARPVSGWISEGSIREDDWCCVPPLRFQYHFFNPIATPGSRGYQGITTDSLQWGLEATEFSTQNYSYRDAREYFYQGLTASTERERQRNMSDAFRSLGQVAHLLQDAAQPQHTRNDSHATGSLYEKYTTLVLGNLDFTSYGPVSVSTPDQLWTTTPGGKGIADYSNRGFVSAGSNLTGTFSGNTAVIGPNPSFPSPNGTGAAVEKRQITDPDLLGPPGPNQTLLGEIWFVSTPVTDNYRPGTVTNHRTSTFSIFDDALQAAGFDWTFSYNRFNFDAAHQLLIPRAVGYSAGLIDYFFRGKLAIGAPDDVVYGMIDPTQKSSFDRIKLKVSNTTPNESMTGGKLWAVAKYHLNTCYQPDLTGEAGGPNAPDIIACRSPSEEIAVSQPHDPITLPAAGSPMALSFDFTANPIPVNATDLFLQVVYRGPLGNEQDAVAVGTKDIFEPTHIAFMNGTDAAQINNAYYLFDDILAGIGAGNATFAPVDLNQDRAYTLPPDYNVTPYDFFNVNVSFQGNNVSPVAVIPVLPSGRFARMTVLTDRPVLDFYPGPYHFQPAAAVNQVSDDQTTYYVQLVDLFRGFYKTNVDIVVYCVFSTPCNGDVSTMKKSNNPDTLTPESVTVNMQFP